LAIIKHYLKLRMPSLIFIVELFAKGES